MQNKGYEIIKNELKVALKDFFGSRIRDFALCGYNDEPYTMFKLEFEMYNYFNVILNYDRGRFGCNIVNGNKFISLKNNQKWYDEADIIIFLQELQQ